MLTQFRETVQTINDSAPENLIQMNRIKSGNIDQKINEFDLYFSRKIAPFQVLKIKRLKDLSKIGLTHNARTMSEQLALKTSG